MSRNLAVSTALLLSLGGCVFASEQDDDLKPCPAIATAPERNPHSGMCESRGTGCYDEGIQPTTDDKGPGWLSPVPPLEPWAACYGSCQGQDEASCQSDPSCQSGYLDEAFWGCWEINHAWLGEGDCASLDAASCSTRNDCVPQYVNVEYQDWHPTTEFARCDAEANIDPPLLSCANVLCDIGTHCEMRDDTGSGPCEAGNDGAGVWGCFPVCVSNETDPGTCYGEIFCDSPAPACPAGTLPGISDGCYSGYCIPVSACEPAPLCESIINEAVCIGRADCAPYYTQCDGPGCELEFAYCGNL